MMFVNFGLTTYSHNKSSPHDFSLPPNFTVFLTHLGDKRSPFLRLTNLLLSDPYKLNLDSSLKGTIIHCSSVHTICSVAKSRRTFWFFFEIKCLQHKIRATNFFLFNPRETIFLEIGFPICSQNAREIDVVVSKRSFKDILTLIQSSHKRPDSSRFWFNCLVSLKCTDYTINNAFWPSYEVKNFRIRFAFSIICENELFSFSS